MTDVYIGIDPGSGNCALVAWSPTRGLITTWKPSGTMPKGVLRLRKLMIEITDQFTKIVAHEPGGIIKKVAMEAYSMGERYGQHASGEIGATIKLTVLALFQATDPRAYPVLVAPGQLKKFVSGNGSTKKEMIAKEVLKRWSVDFDDTNIAEAYVLARIAYAVDAGPEMTKFQQDVITALEGRTEAPPQPWDTATTTAVVGRRRLVRVGK
jgi:Holliday junction resolvasome RuvABC endonuclease subunit